MSDLMASGDAPGTQYQPMETNGVYHEDREVALGTASQMFRVYGAQFDFSSGFWTLQPGASQAYATVQDPYGSIHFLTSPSGMSTWGTPEWVGSGNNAVFNAADFGVSSANPDNSSALSDAINAAIAVGGGRVTIPPGVYPLQGTIDISSTSTPGEDFGIIIAGVSGTTELVQNIETITSDVFSLSGFGSGRGVRFEDLRITYATTGTTPPSLAAAIRLQSCQNVTCERVYFNNCPQAFVDDNNSLENGLFNCTITYNNFSANTSAGVVPTMVNFNGTENYIENCIISQQKQDDTMDPGPTGCIGVLVVPGGGAYFITNTHISHFTKGIVVNDGPNLTRVFCSNVICESWSNSLIIERTGTHKLSQVYCDDCMFERTDGSTDPNSTGVIIDSNGGNDTLGDIFLNNCMCFQWNVAGVQINKGQKIVITGGRYGSNATNSESTSGGIAITGTAADVTISGADLTPTVIGDDYPNQAYAISITAAVNGLYVRGCNMSGSAYTNGPLYLSNAGTQIEITDCAGYNDKGTVVSTIAPSPSGTQFNGTYSGFTTPYFGPVTFYTKMVQRERSLISNSMAMIPI